LTHIVGAGRAESESSGYAGVNRAEWRAEEAERESNKSGGAIRLNCLVLSVTERAFYVLRRLPIDCQQIKRSLSLLHLSTPSLPFGGERRGRECKK